LHPSRIGQFNIQKYIKLLVLQNFTTKHDFLKFELQLKLGLKGLDLLSPF